VEALMHVIYFRAGARFRPQLFYYWDEVFFLHLKDHESVWIVPGTLTAEDFD
jgi:hypothetical protein